MAQFHPILDVGVTADGVVSRRGFLRGAMAAGTGAVALGWQDLLVAKAAELRKAGKSMILLWMDGGPSQYDTFNPKPGSKYQAQGGPSTRSCPACKWPSTGRAPRRSWIVSH